MFRSKKNHASPPKTCFKAMEPRTAGKILKDQAECRKSLTFFINTLEHDRRLLRNNLDRDRLLFSRQQARRISTKSLCLPGNILKEYTTRKTGRGDSKHLSNQRLFPMLHPPKVHLECEESISETCGVTIRVERDNEECLVRQRRFTDVGCSVDQNTFNLQNFIKRSSSCLPPRTHTSSVAKKTSLPYINLQHTRLQNSEPMIVRRSSLMTANDDVDERPETVPIDHPKKIRAICEVKTKCYVHKNANRDTKSIHHRTLSEGTAPSFRTILNSKAPHGIRFNAPPSLRRKPVTAQRKAHGLS